MFFELDDTSRYCPKDQHGKKIAGHCEKCGIFLGHGRMPVQCTCGKFAKYIRLEHYYNGSWNCERMWVQCKEHGLVGIELV